MILCCKLEIKNTLLMFWLNISVVIGVNCKVFSQNVSQCSDFKTVTENLYNRSPVEKPLKVCVTSKVKHLTSDPSRGFVWEVTFCQQRWTSWNHPYTNTFHSCQNASVTTLPSHWRCWAINIHMYGSSYSVHMYPASFPTKPQAFASIWLLRVYKYGAGRAGRFAMMSEGQGGAKGRSWYAVA